jgi:prepilin-type N-terminal cleavage/methylation domain-containing protein
MRSTVNQQHRRGLTLLELVVVLAILAALSMVAVLATETAVEQARFDVTLKTLDDIDNAVLGPPSGATSTEARGFTGFIADIGRPPMTVGFDPNSGTQLQELWVNANGLRLYGPAITSDPNIIVFSGWRGPYLRLTTTPGVIPQLLDGWGNSYRALAADDVTVLGANQPVARVRSDGGAGPPYNSALMTGRSFKDWIGVISGSVIDSTPATSNGPGATLPTEVRLFAPTTAVASGVIEFVRTFDVNGTDTSGTSGTALTGFQFQFPDPSHYPAEVGVGISIGPKVLKISQAGKPPVVVRFWLPAGAYSLTERVDLQ